MDIYMYAGPRASQPSKKCYLNSGQGTRLQITAERQVLTTKHVLSRLSTSSNQARASWPTEQ
eukprot:9615603-Karenia_brevis.AAC.1